MFRHLSYGVEMSRTNMYRQNINHYSFGGTALEVEYNG